MRLPRTKKGMRALVVCSALAALLALGGLLVYWRPWGDESDINICKALEPSYSSGTPSVIVARGSFITHNENFAYVGDIFGFNLEVVYDTKERVTVGDSTLLNFNVSPFTLLDKSRVIEESYALCRVKRITFFMQAVDVEIASKNEFYKINDSGDKERPDIAYAQNNVAHSVSLEYAPLYVSPLTDGMPRPIASSPIPRVASPAKQADGFLHIRLALAAALLASGMVILMLVLGSRRKRALVKVDTDSLRTLFPELFGGQGAGIRLKRLYFNLLVLAENDAYVSVRTLFTHLAERASFALFVEDPERSQGTENAERAEDVLREIQKALEEQRPTLDLVALGQIVKKGGET